MLNNKFCMHYELNLACFLQYEEWFGMILTFQNGVIIGYFYPFIGLKH